MFEITLIGSLIAVVLLVLLYYFANKIENLFDDFFSITQKESKKHIINFSNITNDSIEKIKDINDKSVERLAHNTHIIKELNTHLSKVMQKLNSIENHLDELDGKVINRKELEDEIVKCKNIIKRLEKKNG